MIKFVLAGKHLGDKLWRAFLVLSLIAYIAATLAALTLTEWHDAFQHAAVAAVDYLLINYERTLDRWRPFVPLSIRDGKDTFNYNDWVYRPPQ